MEPTILILIMVSVLLAGAWINSEIANYKQRREIEINRRAWSIARPPSYSRVLALIFLMPVLLPQPPKCLFFDLQTPA